MKPTLSFNGPYLICQKTAVRVPPSSLPQPRRTLPNSHEVASNKMCCHYIQYAKWSLTISGKRGPVMCLLTYKHFITPFWVPRTHSYATWGLHSLHHLIFFSFFVACKHTNMATSRNFSLLLRNCLANNISFNNTKDLPIYPCHFTNVCPFWLNYSLFFSNPNFFFPTLCHAVLVHSCSAF